jgi:hypothetical protein
MVLDELDNLPVVDDRYRLWPWSLRALARRRGTSPGTVHKHVQSLRSAGVLVDDDHHPTRVLVDIARLRDLAGPGADGGPPSEHAAPVVRALTSPADVRANLAWAIDALTTALEARLELADVLTAVIGRLADLMARVGEPDALRSARDGAPSPASEARGRAPIKTREIEPHQPTDQHKLSPLSPTGARRAVRDEGRAGARSTERLLELLAPLNPAQHVNYTEGVVAALAQYDDDQVAYAVTRAARCPATNPVGLLVDRAKKRDPVFFPASVGGLDGPSTPRHDQDCACDGAGVVAVDAEGSAYVPCPGMPLVRRLAS